MSNAVDCGTLVQPLGLTPADERDAAARISVLVEQARSEIKNDSTYVLALTVGQLASELMRQYSEAGKHLSEPRALGMAVSAIYPSAMEAV